MHSRSLKIGTVVCAALATVALARPASAHPVEIAPITGAPPAAFSTSGDYATDVLGDPWDFSNDADVPPILTVGTDNSYGISVGNGVLSLDGHNGSTVKLVRNWVNELGWGRDGLHKPVDASVYTHLSARIYLPSTRDLGVRYTNESGATNINFKFAIPAGWNTIDIDLTQPGLGGAPSVWSGKVVRVELALGGSYNGSDRETIQVDWVRLRRADAPVDPPNAPVVSVLTPSEEGGADYATNNGNPWDFTGPDDVAETGDLTVTSWANGNMNGYTWANDSFVRMPLRSPLVTDHYHRATIDVCYGGGFALTNAPGGGMNARLAWYDNGGGVWTETQDIIILPGCNRMTIDLATNPAVAVNDESSVWKSGWRGVSIGDFRFDLNEDPGQRDFSLNEIKLADDAAFSSNYNITFSSSMAGSADIYVTTTPGGWDGTRIATGIKVSAGNNAFNWDGSGLPNGTYWTYVVVRGSNGTTGASYSTGPVRLEKPVPATPSYFVPLNPARLLDTRDGTGGNISALAAQTYTELNVAGVGGVPPTGASAVVLNVTVDQPWSNGFITAWPSGEAQPTVSNLNFVAGQTVPNLVTVKIGANGKVNLYNSEGYTSLIADVVGYYTSSPPPGGGRFTAVSPGRVLDTRQGAGPVGAGQSIDVKVTGTQGIPASGVSGVALNVTVDQPTSAGFLTVWPTGEARPLASSHNFTPGLTIANLVLAKVGANGQVSIFNSAGNTHVIADVVGYFSSSGGLLVPVSPQRIADSRFGVGNGVRPLGQGDSIDVAVGGVGPVPSNASAAIVNVTSVNSSLPSFLTVWPTGGTRPTASTVNPRPGLPVPNLAYLKLGSGGKLSVFNNTGSTDFLIDVFAYVI